MSSINRPLLICTAIVAIAVAMGCGQFEQLANAAQGLIELTQKLAEEYPNDEIEIEINSYFSGSDATNNLTAYFINSEYGSLSDAAQEKQAREIATFIKTNYASISEIDVIVVVFRYHSEVVVASFDTDLT